MKVKLEEVERYERPMKNRLAFRFGVINVTGGIQAVIRVRISLPDGRTSQGVAAEALAAKWFEKSPDYTDEQNLDQLRQSLDLAIENYKAYGAATPFGLFIGTYREQHKKGAALKLNPLVASYYAVFACNPCGDCEATGAVGLALTLCASLCYPMLSTDCTT